MVVFLHLEGLEGMFQGLGKVRLSEQFIKFGDKFSPVTSDGWFRVSHKVRLPAE